MNDRERIAELEEEVLQLRAMLALEVHEERLIQIRRVFGIQLAAAKLLHILLTRKLLTRRVGELALSADPDHLVESKTVDVRLCQLRASLKGRGLQIRAEWGVGWSLADSTKLAIERLLV